ncbi:hypothetical protein KFE25_006290 [Diacronema lutheri]|uniref:Radical SAM core domain-containing protein n=1 Tax=Diacronema lutheri TaxID=2081491 RepID=A0A8J6CH54_DIALT|nr:hypothetical protein KFE25_006290 [Diacronema lutheri]
MRKRALRPLPVWNIESVLGAFTQIGVKAVHAHALWNWLARNPRAARWDQVRWDEHVGLPARARELLVAEYALYTSSVESAETASDGSTTKLVIRLQDGHAIEAVQIHHAGRLTLCISSQIGCAMGCSFCATGTMGILGDLHAGEILEQLQHARARAPVRNVVFMGMGEPLNNYAAVLESVRVMVDNTKFQLSPTRVTVSTVGIVPRMVQFGADEPRVNLALSLHAPTQATRESIMPAARAYPLPALLGAVDAYLARCRAGKAVMIEYIMLRDVNDAVADAHALADLLARRPVVINLIPYNPTDATPEYARSTEERTMAFLKVLYEERGLRTFVRRTMGSEVASACGQLVKDTQRPGRERAVRDIEDAAGGRAPRKPRRRGGAEQPAAAAAATAAREPTLASGAHERAAALWLALRSRIPAVRFEPVHCLAVATLVCALGARVFAPRAGMSGGGGLAGLASVWPRHPSA